MDSMFKIDFWTFWGFLAQGMFFLRFLVQWVASEKKREIVIPHAFWILSIIGSIMLFFYAIVRRDLVFTTASILQLILFSRNLMISNKTRKVQKNEV